jgi:hypothetical protein
MPDATPRALTLQIVAWLVERHHQSLGLWPWTWQGPEGEPCVTLYAGCVALRFGDDFAALASWVEANRWPPPDGAPYPATFFRHRPAQPDWAVRPPLPDAMAPGPTLAPRPDLLALARAGASIETMAQLLETGSGLADYLATLAPQRHGGHPHRAAAGRTAVRVMRLATAAALALGEDYTVPWTGPAGGRAMGVADPDWRAFARRFRLAELPFPARPQEVFTIGERGWLHAGGCVGDRHGNVLRLAADLGDPTAYTRTEALVLSMLA